MLSTDKCCRLGQSQRQVSDRLGHIVGFVVRLRQPERFGKLREPGNQVD